MGGLMNADWLLGVAWSSDFSASVDALAGLYGVLDALDANDLVGLWGTKACCSQFSTVTFTRHRTYSMRIQLRLTSFLTARGAR